MTSARGRQAPGAPSGGFLVPGDVSRLRRATECIKPSRTGNADGDARDRFDLRSPTLRPQTGPSDSRQSNPPRRKMKRIDSSSEDSDADESDHNARRSVALAQNNTQEPSAKHRKKQRRLTPHLSPEGSPKDDSDSELRPAVQVRQPMQASVAAQMYYRPVGEHPSLKSPVIAQSTATAVLPALPISSSASARGKNVAKRALDAAMRQKNRPYLVGNVQSMPTPVTASRYPSTTSSLQKPTPSASTSPRRAQPGSSGSARVEGPLRSTRNISLGPSQPALSANVPKKELRPGICVLCGAYGFLMTGGLCELSCEKTANERIRASNKKTKENWIKAGAGAHNAQTVSVSPESPTRAPQELLKGAGSREIVTGEIATGEIATGEIATGEIATGEIATYGIRTDKATASTNATGLSLVNIDRNVNKSFSAQGCLSTRAQRFFFPSGPNRSLLSAVSLAALAWESTLASRVCVVCGRGGAIVECRRCPVVFHMSCMTEPYPSQRPHSRLCNGCVVMKSSSETKSLAATNAPPQSSTGLARLIRDASDGNPLDFVLHPSLHQRYVGGYGRDWLRCWQCKRLSILTDDVLAESVAVPYECANAHWMPQADRTCSRKSLRSELHDAARIEMYLNRRSRRRATLFYYDFDEENRENYGFPPADDSAVFDPDSNDHASQPALKNTSDSRVVTRCVSDEPKLLENRTEAPRDSHSSSLTLPYASPSRIGVMNDVSCAAPQSRTNPRDRNQPTSLHTQPPSSVAAKTNGKPFALTANGVGTIGPQGTQVLTGPSIAVGDGSVTGLQFATSRVQRPYVSSAPVITTNAHVSSPRDIVTASPVHKDGTLAGAALTRSPSDKPGIEGVHRDASPPSAARAPRGVELEISPALRQQPGSSNIQVQSPAARGEASGTYASHRGSRTVAPALVSRADAGNSGESPVPGSTANIEKAQSCSGTEAIGQPSDGPRHALLRAIGGIEEPDVEDCLIDMALFGSGDLAALFEVFGDNSTKFIRHATRLARQKLTEGRVEKDAVAGSSTMRLPVGGTRPVTRTQNPSTVVGPVMETAPQHVGHSSAVPVRATASDPNTASQPRVGMPPEFAQPARGQTTGLRVVRQQVFASAARDAGARLPAPTNTFNVNWNTREPERQEAFFRYLRERGIEKFRSLRLSQMNECHALLRTQFHHMQQSTAVEVTALHAMHADQNTALLSRHNAQIQRLSEEYTRAAAIATNRDVGPR